MRPRIALLAVLVLGPFALWAALPLVADAGKAEQLRAKISKTRKKVDRLKSREGVLTETVEAQTARIDRLASRQRRLQADLDAKRGELIRIQDELRVRRARLARLRAKLSRSRVVLSRRLVELYQADRPDIVTVILNSKGFADLLERSEFMARINEQDAKVITSVRRAKVRTKAAADRLAALEERQQRVTAIVLARRNEVASVRIRLASARARKAAALRDVRGDRRHLESHLRELEEESAKVEGRLRGAAGPIRRGSGRFIWPVNGAFTSPFGMRWGRLHAGIDIAAPTGTPIRAVDSGTVQLAGWQGGYGQYTCIGHGGGVSTCYAHQSSIGVSGGQNVSQGQVIGAVGNTGHSTGPHLHFEVRINGSPVDPMGYL